ncbi:MAG: hypothetical protein DRP22_02825 [Verrucomicrobia bacterium]|nr:MAG: hypothetical protein DRP22_02825 [Verrucomicrobiota bacterium]
MLRRLDMCVNHARRVKRYRRVHFEPGMNVIIGPNGTGKSTILRAIADCGHCRRREEGETHYVILETDTAVPRIRSGHQRSDRVTHMILETRALFSSHGEIIQTAFSTIRISRATCLLLDEPETAQDFDHLLALRKAMKRAVDHGAQIICATHEVLFWEGAHVIELRRGYRDRVIREFCHLKCIDNERRE